MDDGGDGGGGGVGEVGEGRGGAELLGVSGGGVGKGVRR